VFLGAELRWVGCQGSRPGLRGYPCSLWTLFHVLTVQHDATPTVLDNTGLEGKAAPVLQVMRHYIRTFFGCKECGQHFEQAAAASMDEVKSPEEEVLWLWNQHNRVNARLAGNLIRTVERGWGQGKVKELRRWITAPAVQQMTQMI
ncbi:Sulfhydryl oxidase 2, partial [Goodea atripinnis]